jgi:hypothetical protein
MALVEAKWNPSVHELRQFGGIWLPAFLTVLGALVGYHRQTWAVPAVCWVSALAISLLGLTGPFLLRPVYVVWMAMFYPVGWTTSHLLLAGVFYVVMAPVGAAMRLFGYDPMGRSFEVSRDSYWVAHNPRGDTARYFRQL